MVNQAEIHRKILSNETKELIDAMQQLGDYFAILPDKKQAWEDLQRLMQDADSEVRRGAAHALYLAFPYIPNKKQAWEDLIQLTRDKERDIRWRAAYALGLVFSYIPDKKQAWEYLRRLLQDKDRDVRGGAASALGLAFPYIPDKKQAWGDLGTLIQNKDRDVQGSAASALGLAFPYIPNKKQAWEDIIKLMLDKNSSVRQAAANALDSVFLYIPDKKQACEDLIQLTHDADNDVRRGATYALGLAFPYISNKKQAWEYLIGLTQDADSEVQRGAAYALDLAFPHIPNQSQAWEDLVMLMREKSHVVRRGVASALGRAFPHTPDKIKAWNDLIRLTQDTDFEASWGVVLGSAFAYIPDKIKAWNDLHELTQKNSLVRREAACAIGIAFPHIPDKKQAYTDLFLLSSDTDRKVRQSAINALGSGYPHLPDKKQAWEHLNQLTLDSDADTRTFANYALGRASIFKAIWVKSEEDFRKELESALNFFEKSAKEAAYIIYLNPAKFCLPFYRSFYLITFKKQEAESDAPMYLAEAKKVVEGSENKEKLLDAIENLDNALKEVHKVRDFKEMKRALIEYVQYCERAADLLDITAKKAPDATELVGRGLPIINASMIAEIHEKAKMLCKQTQSSPFRDLGKEIHRISQGLLQIRDLEGLEININHLQSMLSDICEKIPDEERGEAWELLKKLNEEPYIEHKIPLINMVLSKISSQIGKERELGDKPKTFAGRFFEKITTPATIASFAGFIILEVFDIYPTDYNKHIISVIGAIAIFVAVFIVTRKKN